MFYDVFARNVTGENGLKSTVLLTKCTAASLPVIVNMQASLEECALTLVYYEDAGRGEKLMEIACLDSPSAGARERNERFKTWQRKLKKMRVRILKICDWCASEGTKLKTCARCKMRYYCSKRCQRKAWSRHVEHCVSSV